jgi:hypothetical protein
MVFATVPDEHETDYVSPVSTRFQPDIQSLASSALLFPTPPWQILLSGEKMDFEDDVDFLVGNMGILTNWRWPDIPNRGTFKGHMAHSAIYDTR